MEKKLDGKLFAKKHTTQAILAVAAVIMMSFAVVPSQLKPALATHGTECNTQVAITCGVRWDRSTSGGHRVELECASSTSTSCKIPFILYSSLTQVNGNPTTNDIVLEAGVARVLLGGATTQIGLVQKTPTTYWDNKVWAATLISSSYSGDYTNVLKHGSDKHLQRVEVRLNKHVDAVPYARSETCSGSSTIATTFDLSKVFSHEFYHMMGFDHSSEHKSPVYDFYQCGSTYGYTRTAHDTAAIQAKYP